MVAHVAVAHLDAVRIRDLPPSSRRAKCNDPWHMTRWLGLNRQYLGVLDTARFTGGSMSDHSNEISILKETWVVDELNALRQENERIKTENIVLIGLRVEADMLREDAEQERDALKSEVERIRTGRMGVSAYECEHLNQLLTDERDKNDFLRRQITGLEKELKYVRTALRHYASTTREPANE
jgi:hypothetical protein